MLIVVLLYVAAGPVPDATLAIKVLPTSFSSDPQRLHRFEQEANAAAALNRIAIASGKRVLVNEVAPADESGAGPVSEIHTSSA